ncbi:MAG: four helix bundle protein [Candidatus Omnitrophota bacterium]
MKNYSDLEIYQLAHNLAIEIHKITLELPNFEVYEEGSQIRRSSKAVSANIVEGFGRRKYKADYMRFLIYAHASCDETIEHLKFLFETGSFKNKKHFDVLIEEYTKLSKKINKFLQAF